LAALSGTSEARAEGAAKDLPRPAAVKVVKDVAYYDGAGNDPIKHKLDLFLPEGRKDFPVVLFVHGGAWLHGDKNFLGFYSALGRSLARQGIGVAVTNYRLSPGVKHPEHVKDVARAFAWVHKNAGKYGGRADRLFVCGHSAGGHLVALLATDESYLRGVGLSTNNVRGVIPISGVYNVPNGFLPMVFGTGKDAGKKASPITFARAGLPPFLILWADEDFPSCGRAPSEAFAKALRDKGNKAVQGVEVKENNHYSIIVNAKSPESSIGKAIVGFIRKYGA
jgi:acetyl esterase/lipase